MLSPLRSKDHDGFQFKRVVWWPWKSSDVNASTEHNGHARSSQARYPKSPYGDTESYVELDEWGHEFKSIDSSKTGPAVWSDEGSASDEEKTLPSIEEDGITRAIGH